MQIVHFYSHIGLCGKSRIMTDCIIIGGGLIGMLSARELTKLGMDVLVLDKGALGKESSWAGGGILSPLHPWRYSDEVNELANEGHRLYPLVAKELYQESGVDPEYIKSGLLIVNSSETEQAKSWANKWSMDVFVLDSVTELQKVSPGLGNTFSHGLWLPDVAQMRNPRLVKAAKGSLQTLGVRYEENTQVERLDVVNGQIKGVVANGKSYQADCVLVASGAWSAELLSEFESPPEITPVKGQMILLKGKPGLLKSMILAENRYLIPRKDGRILCGSTIEHTGFEKSVSEDVKESLLHSAVEIYPQLANLDVEHHWSGLRPGSPGGVPYIGSHNEIKGLYVNAGHFRNGVILGIASARKIAREIMRRK